MCQGKDPEKIHTDIPAPKSMGHGKVMPPDTHDTDVILTFLQHMSEKLGSRLRRHSMRAQHFAIGLKTAHGWLGAKLKLVRPTDDNHAIYNLCRFVLTNHWHGEGVFQVQVTALDPQTATGQLDLFSKDDNQHADINHVMDRVNQRFGEFSLAPARLLNRSDMPNVIAPAWKPEGHRQTIDD
jgi:DNA polymerase-4